MQNSTVIETWDKYPFRALKLFHSIMIFCIFLSLGLGIIIFQAITNEAERVTDSLNIAVKFLDSKILDANTVAKNVLEDATLDCSNAKKIIDTALLETPSIQSITLISSNKVICSSFVANVGKIIQSNKYNGLTLQESKYTVPGKPILIVGQQTNGFQVLVTLHAPSMFSVIQLFYINSMFKINMNHQSIGMDLKLIPRGNTIYDYIRESKLYPFNITASVNTQQTIYKALTRSWLVLFLLIAFSIILPICYYQCGNPIVIKTALKSGIKRREFKPYAHAIVNTAGKVTGCEILMRWEYKGKLISPNYFIPAAEGSSLIVPMTLHLIEQVHMNCLENNVSNKSPFYLSINICPIQLSKANSPALIEACKRFTDDHQLKHVTLVLEITERQIITNDPDTLMAVDQLLELGVKLAIDDFGTGYSCLENIKDFKVNAIKIDKCFIDHYPDDEHCFNLVSNILDLSNRLNIPIIAEGVETQSQADALVLNGVTNLQGYLYHKPEPMGHFLTKRLS